MYVRMSNDSCESGQNGMVGSMHGGEQKKDREVPESSRIEILSGQFSPRNSRPGRFV